MKNISNNEKNKPSKKTDKPKKEKAKVSNRRRLINIFIICISTLLVLYVLTIIIPLVAERFFDETDVEYTDPNYTFYPSELSENIFEDPEYMSLTENGILLYDNGSNSILYIDEENAHEFGEEAKILVKMIYSAIRGNADEYNSCFSNEYYKSNTKKEPFTMQRIYNGKITYISSETVTAGNSNYTKSMFKVTYYIDKNNGSFRRDIIDDKAKEEYYFVSNKGGSFLIESIVSAKNK